MILTVPAHKKAVKQGIHRIPKKMFLVYISNQYCGTLTLYSFKPQTTKKKVTHCKLTKVGWISIQKSDKEHMQIMMSPTFITQTMLSVALKNKCHILLFSELVYSSIGVCRILRTTEPRRKRERRQPDSPKKAAAQLALYPKHHKTERQE